jgi:hypothetical protein
MPSSSAHRTPSYRTLPQAQREARVVSFALEVGGWWWALLALIGLSLPWLVDAWRADALDRWRAERLQSVMASIATQLETEIDLAGGGFRDRDAALQILDRALTGDASIRSIELYDGERRQHLSTDRGSLGASMPPAWQTAAGRAESGAWLASRADERDYALGTQLQDRNGNFAGYMVVAATRPSQQEIAIASPWRYAALVLALFAAAVSLLVLVAPYARLVAEEEAMLELVGDEAPDDDDTEAPPQKARGVIARVRRRLKAALSLLGAEAGGA